MKRSKFHGLLITGSLITGLLILGHWLFAQGPLDPASAPAPTFKTLHQVQPRTPISLLPFTISQPGSYYLTTNLTGSAGVTNGITITAGSVTLDLMGFELVGGTGDGILVSGNRTNLAIRNGTVRKWTGNGVAASDAFNSQFEALRASHNGVDGLRAGVGCSFTRCTATANTNVGMVVSDGGQISGCTATANRYGIAAGIACVISDCTATGNTGAGISVDEGSTISGCTASDNIGDGILVYDRSLVLDNTCSGNGAGNGSGAGIYASGFRNRIDGNNVTGNDRGIQSSGFNTLIVRNSAFGNTGTPMNGGASADYDFSAADTIFGPIVTKPNGALTFTGPEGHPWANFRY